MKSLNDLIARLKEAAFREPVELQEWYDVGSDIRIEIRKQFSHVNLLKTEIIQALETQSKVIEKMREALEKIEHDAMDYIPYRDLALTAMNALKECEALEDDNG